MKTVFKVGMEVYDQLVFPDKKGKVVNIAKFDYFPIKVLHEGSKKNISYTEDGRYYTEIEPTLSTKPYTLQGFEQKAPVPTFEEVVKDKNYIYLPENLVAPNKELADATKALLKLLFLRDYYNEGWQPDWCNQHQEKFCIINFLGEIDLINYSKKSKFEENKFYHVLTFETEEIRDKFLEDQKELLEIAKPLL